MLKEINFEKKAVSLMLSYVLLISIVIALSVGVFAWIRTMAEFSPPVDCKEGTSIILEDLRKKDYRLLTENITRAGFIRGFLG